MIDQDFWVDGDIELSLQIQNLPVGIRTGKIGAAHADVSICVDFKRAVVAVKERGVDPVRWLTCFSVCDGLVCLVVFGLVPFCLFRHTRSKCPERLQTLHVNSRYLLSERP